MALHHATLKSAVNKYGPLVAEGKTEEEIKSEIAQDEKGFEPEGIDEIYAAITAPPEENEAAKKEKAAAKAGKGAAKDCYTVVQEFRDITDFTWIHNVDDDVSYSINVDSMNWLKVAWLKKKVL
jgi:hypothetical protein